MTVKQGEILSLKYSLEPNRTPVIAEASMAGQITKGDRLREEIQSLSNVYIKNK